MMAQPADASNLPCASQLAALPHPSACGRVLPFALTWNVEGIRHCMDIEEAAALALAGGSVTRLRDQLSQLSNSLGGTWRGADVYQLSLLAVQEALFAECTSGGADPAALSVVAATYAVLRAEAAENEPRATAPSSGMCIGRCAALGLLASGWQRRPLLPRRQSYHSPMQAIHDASECGLCRFDLPAGSRCPVCNTLHRNLPRAASSAAREASLLKGHAALCSLSGSDADSATDSADETDESQQLWI